MQLVDRIQHLVPTKTVAQGCVGWVNPTKRVGRKGIVGFTHAIGHERYGYHANGWTLPIAALSCTLSS